MNTAASTPRTLRYLEDFTIGERFRTSSYLIDSKEIIEFASRYDPQPFHLDAQAAQNSFFAGLACSGWMTAALTMRLIVQSGLPIAGGIIGAEVNLAWPIPTRPGDTLYAESEILEITPSHSKPDRGIMTVCTCTYNQHNDVVQKMVSKQLVFRRPATV